MTFAQILWVAVPALLAGFAVGVAVAVFALFDIKMRIDDKLDQNGGRIR